MKNLKGTEEGARTVAIAFPAYIGRENVVLFEEGSCETEMISETAGTSSFAATRGRRDFAEEEWAETIWVYGEPLASSFSRSGETTSGTGEEYCGAEECRTVVTPFSLKGKQGIQKVKDR